MKNSNFLSFYHLTRQFGLPQLRDNHVNIKQRCPSSHAEGHRRFMFCLALRRLQQV